MSLPRLLHAWLFCPALSAACTSSTWQGEWEVVAWDEQLYPTQSAEFDALDDTFTSGTTSGAARLDEQEMLVTFESHLVVISADGREETIETAVISGEVTVTGARTFDLSVMEEGESRRYLMLCKHQTDTLLVCDRVQSDVRAPSVFVRDAP